MYAIDLLGFGRSDKPLMDYSTELWRDQLLEFLAEFCDRPAVLIGNSIGSLVSLMVRESKPWWLLCERGAVILYGICFGRELTAANSVWKGSRVKGDWKVKD